ncbi:MAG TPA: 2Fe-2S iron-sulfur cluster-binding protein [Acidisoma sp.]|uniref:flavin reductase family protein n=1 Tax=Acidisoma sp. TaxID=1872115 RepID=UPI002CF18179|nr:2Fe-2S iron-sulfur cluster-binding protein [Acidisoma sp.]HTI02502.1 2Fe-2S iron-sulfur cluster-binding protein [Acidisoma sp.]
MADPAIWSGGADLLRCLSVTPEAPGVKTFRFAPESGLPLRFHAGQFVTLGLPLAAGTVWRCFTIASSPLQTEAIDLTIKTQGGEATVNASATAWMHAHLEAGMTLAAQPPAGPFCLMHPPEVPLLLVSAGSGATPMVSIARFLRDIGDRTPVHYVHLARSESELLFKAEIEAIAGELGSWTVDWLTTASGRPDAASFARLTPDLARREVFCCGPAGFMASVEDAHAKAGGPAARFRKEAFVAIPIPELAPHAAAKETATRFTLRFQPAGRETEAGPEETVLAAAGRLGIAIPYACGDGICGTCRIRKTSGEVEMHHQGGIEEEEIADGEILACCSYPRSHLVLEV